MPLPVDGKRDGLETEWMMRVWSRVGRLAEVCFRVPFGPDELSNFMANVRTLVAGATEPLVFFTDWRGVKSFTESEHDTIVWIMRRDNPRIEANAVLVDPSNAAFATDVMQLLVEAGNPSRKAFSDKDELRRFLAPRLRPKESQRLEELLSE